VLAFSSTQNRTGHMSIIKKCVKYRSEHMYLNLILLQQLRNFFFAGHDVADPPKPRVSPFALETEKEINKQINRELFAHYTYMSMVSF